MQERSDEQLMVAVMAGDQVALATLVTRHHGSLLGYLYRLSGGDRTLAEDLVQETLLHVLRQRTYRCDRPFKPWLYRIATNLARDHFKSAAVRRSVREGDAAEVLLHLYESEPSPEEQALAAEQGKEVRAALAQLREEERVVVLLRFYQTLPTVLLLLVLLLPFVTADGVTRDLHRHTYELLLTTALSTRAYVWGRYLVCLAMSLGLTVLLLCATLLMGWLLHLTVPLYPAPQIEAVFSLWIGLVVPATILVGSLSFALGTLFPRQSTLIKTAVLVVWTVGAEILPFSLGSTLTSTWYSNWDPTGAVPALKILSQTPDPQLHTATSLAQFQQALLSYENAMPSIGEWFIPHLLLVGVSLVLVLIAAFTFKRFRETLN